MKRVGVDIGGTFTDLVCYDEESGEMSRTKVLTTSERPDLSFLSALEQAQIDLTDIGLLMHGTTLVTNLLIQRRGGRVGLLTTLGFRDLLDIQFSTRPNPFNFVMWDKTVALVPRERRLEVSERTAASGDIITPLDTAAVTAAAEKFRELAVESVAVCFLHSFVNPENELGAREILAKALPGVPISLSHQVDPTIREYERTSTTVTNSYVQKAVGGYVDALARALPVPVNYMHSGGGILPGDAVKKFPVLLSMSGPAAGVLAGVHLAGEEQLPDLITFDMGGTSTDVSLIRGGRPEMRDSIDVDWNIPARALSVDVKSVGAGGGSIAHVDLGGVLVVGPQSAGSRPGPACYGFGGNEPTVTDANLVLGLIDEELLGGRLALDRLAATEALTKLGERLGMSMIQAARAVYRVVNTNMALAIRQITVEKGIDPRGFTLVSFGGAGGQHAIPVADELGMSTVIFAPQASTFSAMGLLTADLTMSQAQTLYGDFESVPLEDISGLVKSLGEASATHLECNIEGVSQAELSATLDLRYVGQSHHVSVPYRPGRDTHADVVDRFEDIHEVLFGTRLGDAVELVNVRAVASRSLPAMQRLVDTDPLGNDARPHTSRWLEFEGREVPIVARETLGTANVLDGPAMVMEVDSSHVIPTGWQATIGRSGGVIVHRTSESAGHSRGSSVTTAWRAK
jgi:N-methylhydantoinase A